MGVSFVLWALRSFRPLPFSVGSAAFRFRGALGLPLRYIGNGNAVSIPAPQTFFRPCFVPPFGRSKLRPIVCRWRCAVLFPSLALVRWVGVAVCRWRGVCGVGVAAFALRRVSVALRYIGNEKGVFIPDKQKKAAPKRGGGGPIWGGAVAVLKIKCFPFIATKTNLNF